MRVAHKFSSFFFCRVLLRHDCMQTWRTMQSPTPVPTCGRVWLVLAREVGCYHAAKLPFFTRWSCFIFWAGRRRHLCRRGSCGRRSRCCWRRHQLGQRHRRRRPRRARTSQGGRRGHRFHSPRHWQLHHWRRRFGPTGGAEEGGRRSGKSVRAR